MSTRVAPILFGVLGVLAVLMFGCGSGASLDSGVSGSSGSNATGGAIGPDLAPEGNAALAEAERKIVVTSSIDLEVPALRQAYEQIGLVARSYGGFVADGRISDRERNPTASLRLRVPAARHDALLADLRAYRDVRVLREDTSAREITEEYTDVQARLRNLQRQEAQYQELLAQARNVDEVLNVTGRLQSVRDEIERAQGRLNLLDSLTDFATVSVALSLPAPLVRSTLPGPIEVFAGAFAVSQDVALMLLNVAIVLLVAGAWLLPAGIAGLVGWKAWRRIAPALKAKLL